LQVLVLTNYLWYKKYNWHLDHLDANDHYHNVKFVNLAECNSKLTYLYTIFWTLLNANNLQCILIDGYTSFIMYFCLPNFKKKSVRLVLASQNYTLSRKGLRNKLKIYLLKKIFNSASIIILPSNLTKKDFNNYFTNKVMDKMHVLHSAINFERKSDFLPFIPENNDIPMAAGVSVRDYKTLSSALVRLNYQEFYVNTSKVLFEKHFKKFTNCTRLTHINTRELLEQIRVAEFIVIPLPETGVNSGLRILFFALELGKPIIIAKTRAIQEYFPIEEPFLTYPPGDVEQLIRQMNRLRNGEELRKKLGCDARVFVENNLLSSKHFETLWNNYVEGEQK